MQNFYTDPEPRNVKVQSENQKSLISQTDQAYWKFAYLFSYLGGLFDTGALA